MEASKSINFLVGMSRSGITPLSRCLNHHPEIAVFGQSRFWGRHYIAPETREGLTAKQLEELEEMLCRFDWTATLGGSLEGRLHRLDLEGLRALIRRTLRSIQPPSTPGATFAAVARAIGEAEGKPCVIEKTPHHLNWTSRILEQLPDAKFLALLARPYAFAFILRQQRDIAYHPLMAAILWRAYIVAYRRAKQKHPDKIFTLDIGELARDPRECLEGVADFLGVQKMPMRSLPNYMRDVLPDNPADQLSLIDIFWMNRICDLMKFDLGQERCSSRGLAMHKVCSSLMTVPNWAVGMIQTMRQDHKGSLSRYLLHWLMR